MQDSIEDYIRICKNKKYDELKSISKEIIITAERKKECHARAMKIVEFSIEGKLHPGVFLKSLRYIDQTHFQDIVEERAISKLCGYPICGRKIPSMPSKQYHISTKQNKIYDITDRKNYCSNFCYKAGIHIKSQIDTSPLWSRGSDDVPRYTLLPSNVRGLPGEEIDQGIAKPVVEPTFTSVCSFTQFSLDEIMSEETVEKKGSPHKPASKASSKALHMETIKEDSDNESENQKKGNFEEPTYSKSEVTKHKENIETTEMKESSLKVDELKGKKSTYNNSEVTKHEKNIATTEMKESSLRVDELKEKNSSYSNSEVTKHEENIATTEMRESSLKLDEVKEVSPADEKKQKGAKTKKSSKRRGSKSSTLVSIDVESHIKDCLSEWFTLETHIFLFGEEEVKTKLADEKFMEFFKVLKINEDKRIQEKKYVDICRRLHLKNLADVKFDEKLIGNSTLEPLPDYNKLKAEGKQIDLKVKSFYGGMLYETTDSNFSSKNTPTSENANEGEDGAPAVLPLVDSKSQTALRRKIFLSSAQKAMQTLVQKLKIPVLSVMSDLQSLVKTFELKANNIVFKPHVWNYISVALLKVLSLKNAEVQEALEAEQGALEYINLIISELPSSHGFIDYALDLSKNSDYFLKKYLGSSRS